MVLIQKSFCWNYNNFKQSSKMSFVFYIDNGFANVATEQYPNFYQNIIGFYQHFEEMFPTTNYTMTWPQNDQLSICCQNITNLSTISKDNCQSNSPIPMATAPKYKRRIEKSLEKEILSAKKNSQSNIINQFYSFFSSREKSEKVVERCAVLMGKPVETLQSIMGVFYTAVRFINAKRGRKYVNVSMFLKFFTSDQFCEYLSQMKDKIEKLDYLTVEQLCEIFRRCSKYFLKDISISAIMTSKRISMVSKNEHLKKRRRILSTVMGN